MGGKETEARTLYSPPPNLAGAASQGAHPDLALGGRTGKTRGRAPQGSGRRVRQATVQTPRLAERPPRPLRLSSWPADGAPRANFAGEEEATQLITRYVNARGKERVSVRLPAGRAVSPSLCRAPAAPAHLRRGPGRRRGRRDGRYGTRPPLRRRVALSRGAGRARQAGGAAAPTGREAAVGSARAGSPLLT